MDLAVFAKFVVCLFVCLSLTEQFLLITELCLLLTGLFF